MHVQGQGWQSWRHESGVAGSQGSGLRSEAVQIKATKKLYVIYRAHVQGKGGLPWVRNGDVAGTTGQAKRLDGIQVLLSYS
ncbi:hypothetical protein BCR21_09900 [Enterococcus ureasiticus]|uniref:Uncharacterized protein n=2 Tax=Enterococcus ureasiticus TaxID=903984 RepID=A0A1E5GFU4_9ENTE|nr:hypothetical protein BCR21_09900 [Enterococcus ureasiticus]